MAASDHGFRLDDEPGSLGLKCADKGLSLAGAPLLRTTVAGFTPRPSDEIGLLMKAAYGRDIDAVRLSPRLGEIAGALNRGDLGRAMIAAVHLRLPDLNWAGAVRIARADEALTKYDPDEPRDERGRWTTGAGAGGPPGAYGGRLIPVAADEDPDLGIGGNRPPPDAESIPEARPDPRARVPPGWDVPPQTMGGAHDPATRNPTLPDGTPWPIANRDLVKSVLALQPGVTPSMVLYAPADGIGPLLVGSTATADYRRPLGYDSVTLMGTPQKTYSGGSETGHANDSIDEALALAATNHFSTIYFNRSLVRATGGTVVSFLRPDVFAVLGLYLAFPIHTAFMKVFLLVRTPRLGVTR